MHRVLVLCLLAMMAMPTGCAPSRSDGLNIEGRVEAGGPWKPYDSDWDGQSRDLPQSPGSQAVAAPVPAQAAAPAPAAPQAALPTYGIPELQRPQALPSAEPSVRQVIRTQFPEPAAAPADATYRNVEP